MNKIFSLLANSVLYSFVLSAAFLLVSNDYVTAATTTCRGVSNLERSLSRAKKSCTSKKSAVNKLEKEYEAASSAAKATGLSRRVAASRKRVVKRLASKLKSANKSETRECNLVKKYDSAIDSRLALCKSNNTPTTTSPTPAPTKAVCAASLPTGLGCKALYPLKANSYNCYMGFACDKEQKNSNQCTRTREYVFFNEATYNTWMPTIADYSTLAGSLLNPKGYDKSRYGGSYSALESTEIPCPGTPCSTPCYSESAKRCLGDSVQVCTNGCWSTTSSCARCAAGQCLPQIEAGGIPGETGIIPPAPTPPPSISNSNPVPPSTTNPSNPTVKPTATPRPAPAGITVTISPEGPLNPGVEVRVTATTSRKVAQIDVYQGVGLNIRCFDSSSCTLVIPALTFPYVSTTSVSAIVNEPGINTTGRTITLPYAQCASNSHCPVYESCVSNACQVRGTKYEVCPSEMYYCLAGLHNKLSLEKTVTREWTLGMAPYTLTVPEGSPGHSLFATRSGAEQLAACLNGVAIAGDNTGSHPFYYIWIPYLYRSDVEAQYWLDKARQLVTDGDHRSGPGFLPFAGPVIWNYLEFARAETLYPSYNGVGGWYARQRNFFETTFGEFKCRTPEDIWDSNGNLK